MRQQPQIDMTIIRQIDCFCLDLNSNCAMETTFMLFSVNLGSGIEHLESQKLNASHDIHNIFIQRKMNRLMLTVDDRVSVSIELEYNGIEFALLFYQKLF